MRWTASILTVVILASLAAPLISPYDPMKTNTDQSLAAPSLSHPSGTDLLGRDVFTRVLHGGQRTLSIALLAVVVAVTPSILVILVGGIGTVWDRSLTITLNAMLAIPALLLSLVLITVLGRGWWQISIAVGVSQVAPYARVARGTVLQIFAMPYIDGARASGATSWWIATRYVMPNALPTLAAYAGVMFSYAIINSAALGFLGLGGAPGIPEWGAILAEGRLVFQTAPWVSITPGLMIVITVMTVNHLVDQIR